MTSELIVWHDLDGYSRGVVNGHDRYLIQPVALEGFHGFELLKPTSEGDLQLGYYKRVSTAKQIAEDREAARERGGQRERPERFERRTGAEEDVREPGPFRYDNDRDLEILLDVERPLRSRNPYMQPQDSVVYDRHYAILSKYGYIKWVQVHEHHQTLGQDHYELTDKGREALDEYRRWSKRMATPVNRRSSEPWPTRHRASGANEDGGPSGALDWKQHGGDWVAKTFGGASYRLVPEGEDGFHTYYERGGHKEDLGGHTTLGAAMGAARRHRPPMSRAAEEGGAEERVPVVHEDGVEAAVVSVTKSETVTVAAAQEAGGSEDFSTVGHAEQHAYTEGFRFIAKHGKRYHVYKRKPVGKKGYERREMYHRRGKWHISGDKRFVSRLGRDARKILVDQGAKTIPIEHAAEAGRPVVRVSAPMPSFELLTKDQQEKAERAYDEGISAGTVLGNGMTTDPDGQNDIRRMSRTGELRRWAKQTAENEAEREDHGRYWQEGFREGLARRIDAWAKHNIRRYGSIASEGPKFERCVRAVKKRGGAVNPYAVCTTSVGQGREGGGRLTLAQAKAELRPLGLVLISHDGEYRVNFRRGDEESAYYTTDLDDALATGKDMAKRSASEAAEDHLTTAQRSRLPASAFAMPEQRKLPIQNRKHVRAAASRLSMMLHDGTISQADHDRALKRVQRAGRRLGVNVSAAASEASEPAKERSSRRRLRAMRRRGRGAPVVEEVVD